MFVFFPLTLNRQVSKDDALEFVGSYRKFAGIVILSLTVLLVIYYLTVLRSLLELYESFDAELPFITRNITPITIIGGLLGFIISAYLSLSRPNAKKISQQLSGYDDEDIVPITKLINPWFGWIFEAVVMAVVGFFLLLLVSSLLVRFHYY